MNNMFNSTVSNIIRECAKMELECGDNYDCSESCVDFQNTMANLPNVDMSYTIESLPIMKCNEGFMIEYDILSKFMESYAIEDEVEAHSKICEHYDIHTSSLIVVVESDDASEHLLEHAKKSKKTSIIDAYTQSVKKMKNKGIKVAKKSSKPKTRFSRKKRK